MGVDILHPVSQRDLVPRIGREPVVAANGGSLLKESDILQAGPLLGSFLEERSMRTGFHFARHRDQPRFSSPFTLTPRHSWRTAIGPRYYEPNFEKGKGNPSIETRRGMLADSIAQDTELVQNWHQVEETLSGMDNKARVRVERAVLQILANDAAAVDYAYQVANLYHAGLEDTFPQLTDKAVNVVSAYYKHLLDPTQQTFGSQLREFFPSAGEALNMAGDHLRVREPNLDYIRTRRETDSIKTLSAAKTFMQELQQDSDQPTVVVPLFGAYNIRPALEAFKFKGKCVYVLAHEKRFENDSETSKRNTVGRTITEDPVVLSLRTGNDIAVFEDSIGTGEHTIGTEAEPGLIQQLLKALDGSGRQMRMFRAVFDGRRWYPDKYRRALAQIEELTGGSSQSYFAQELLGNEETRNSPITTKIQRTHARWLGKNVQAA